jgi:hypothetical protein
MGLMTICKGMSLSPFCRNITKLIQTLVILDLQFQLVFAKSGFIQSSSSPSSPEDDSKPKVIEVKYENTFISFL